MKTKLSLVITLALIFGLAFGPDAAIAAQKARRSRQAEVWRRQPPKPGPARPFKLPAQREVKLENGLTLVMIADRRMPMVTITLGIPVGAAHDPPGQPGLAEATADLLTEGVGARSSEQLAREVETLGGRLYASAGDDYTEIGVSVVSENAGQLLEILGDVALRPAFPENEVALYKDNRVQGLEVQRQDPAFLVNELFHRVVYGAHPYAISAPTPEAVAALDRAKIESFYQANYTPAGSALVIVGDFEPAKMEGYARTIFGAWKAPAAPERKFPPLPERTARRVYLIDRPGSEQADFRIGNLAVAHADADYFPLLVANTILGGGASSRLFLNLREEKGYTYDVFSSVNAPLQRGIFFGGSATRTEVTLPAIKEMLAEFHRLRNQKVTPQDLRNAKNFLTGVFSLALSTQGGVVDAVLDTYMLGLKRDYLETYRARIEAVTAEQIQQAARKYILTDKPAVVVVGDATKLRKALEEIGPVEVFDVSGKPAN
ncbi:MAG TPA: pitrilysin family protein [Blastocatellia bacterium]|nr:pitrilysin family protein [Blastocatellia bacterium]